MVLVDDVGLGLAMEPCCPPTLELRLGLGGARMLDCDPDSELLESTDGMLTGEAVSDLDVWVLGSRTFTLEAA